MSSPSSLRNRFAPRLEGLDPRTVPAVFTVGNLADSGAGSLRQAVLDANAAPGADVIAFARGLRGTVALTSGELGLTDDVLIAGTGANRLAVSGSDLSRVFRIDAGADVVIDGLTVTRGRALLRGGGIRNDGALTLIDALLKAEDDYIPVIAPIGVSEEGQTYNINADTVAGAMAGALEAKRMLLLTDVAGVLDKDGQLIRQMTVAEAKAAIETGVATGGMIPKLETAIAAVESGVEAVVILDGRRPHAMLVELFTEHGSGTLVSR